MRAGKSEISDRGELIILQSQDWSKATSSPQPPALRPSTGLIQKQVSCGGLVNAQTKSLSQPHPEPARMRWTDTHARRFREKPPSQLRPFGLPHRGTSPLPPPQNPPRHNQSAAGKNPVWLRLEMRAD